MTPKALEVIVHKVVKTGDELEDLQIISWPDLNYFNLFWQSVFLSYGDLKRPNSPQKPGQPCPCF